jgi:hypothetical protein
MLMLITLLVLSSCRREKIYSSDEQYHLMGTRVPLMSSDLEFSFRLTPAQVPVGQEISFVATFTNTTNTTTLLWYSLT